MDNIDIAVNRSETAIMYETYLSEGRLENGDYAAFNYSWELAAMGKTSEELLQKLQKLPAVPYHIAGPGSLEKPQHRGPSPRLMHSQIRG